MISIMWVKTIIQLLSGPPVKMTNDPYQKSISWQRLSAHNFTTTERAVTAAAAGGARSLQELDFSVENYPQHPVYMGSCNKKQSSYVIGKV